MDLPPWLSAPYFQTPVAQSLTPPAGVATLIAPADPNRVLIVMACSGGNAVFSNDQISAASSKGVVQIPNIPPLVVNHDWWGPITCMEWWVNCNGSIWFWTLSLAKWPQTHPRRQMEARPPWYQRLAALAGRQ